MWQARKNEKEKCRLYFAKVYELKKEEAMKAEFKEVERDHYSELTELFNKIEFEKVKYSHYSELTDLFNDDNLFHAKRGMFLKVDEFDVLVELVEDGDEVYKRNNNSGTKMKTEIKYEKIDYDFWSLSELKEIFDRGELYHKAGGQFYQFKNLSELSTSAVVKSGIYKRVEAPLTIEREIADLDICARYEDDFILLHDECAEFWVSVRHILELADVLKRHGK